MIIIIIQAASALCFSHDGGFIYSGGEDAMLSQWNFIDILDTDRNAFGVCVHYFNSTKTALKQQ
jgi:hypothetical protein